jgi:hypothetical protein
MVYFFVYQTEEYLFSFIGVALLYIKSLRSFLKPDLVPQIYENTTRVNANKFATFALWKLGGYKDQNSCTNGR